MKDMKKTAALLAAMALLGVGSASAAEAAPMYALKGITVTATRQAESLKDVPANVQVITEKDIKLRNVQTASDAVAMATGVSASNSVEGTVNLRGYSSKNILVLVDGQQMNTAWNGDVDWNMIPVENIRKIEVVSGGQSALYGGRAVGGVINIHDEGREAGRRPRFCGRQLRQPRYGEAGVCRAWEEGQAVLGDIL